MKGLVHFMDYILEHVGILLCIMVRRFAELAEL